MNEQVEERVTGHRNETAREEIEDTKVNGFMKE